MLELKLQFMVEVIDLKNYQESVTRLLDRLDFSRTLKQVDKILIKPNLLEDVPPPCTTHKSTRVAAIIEYIRNCKPGAEIAVIEGSGGCDTQKAFKALGYELLKEKYGIRLIRCGPLRTG
ncbi:MAG: DUF362 domain-containing protein [Actinomycetota bacterium]|nr:DUF362 domain-containing protein [Actinomycetota bacterium]